jgi:DNA-binding transcriptional regulator LsrR (DeoR family)
MAASDSRSRTARPGTADSVYFAPSFLHRAAKLYYEEDATQAQVAAKLGVSRATISRMLSEARRQGIVRIEIVAPHQPSNEDLADRLAATLGLDRVYLSSPLPAASSTRLTAGMLGSILAPHVGRALASVGLLPGDVLLVSSGRTMYEVAQSELPELRGIVVAPTLGGTHQPERWYQTNEIVRLIADRVGGQPTYLFAPALPGPDLYQTLQLDPAIQQVLHLWPHARCALVGVGAPPTLRSNPPQFLPTGATTLLDAIGDVCSRFYNRAGEPVSFPGSERLIALELADLQRIPVSIAVAAGQEKVISIAVGARAKYFNQLVTDQLTAEQILLSTDGR